MITAVLSSILALAPSEPRHEAMTPPDDGGASPFAQASVGGGAAWVVGTERQLLHGAGTFGIEAGALLHRRRRLRLSLGGALAMTGHGGGDAWPSFGNTDLLAKVRIGGLGRRVWGYGLFGAGISLLTEDGGDYFTLESGPTALAGVGLQFPAGQFVTFGFEVEGGVTYEPPQGLRARVGGLLVVGFRFAP